jgi:hypothetical protein
MIINSNPFLKHPSSKTDNDNITKIVQKVFVKLHKCNPFINTDIGMSSMVLLNTSMTLALSYIFILTLLKNILI